MSCETTRKFQIFKYGKQSLKRIHPHFNWPVRQTMSELQPLSKKKRQIVIVQKKVITLGSFERGSVEWEEEIISKKFAEEHLKS